MRSRLTVVGEEDGGVCRNARLCQWRGRRVSRTLRKLASLPLGKEDARALAFAALPEVGGEESGVCMHVSMASYEMERDG